MIKTISGLKENAVVLFTGDSITDAGRSYSDLSSLGSNHPKLFSDFIKNHFNDENITVINTGVAGDTLLDLYFRLEEDCYTFNPDYIILLIGVNDSWNEYAGNDVFERSYRLILDSILMNTNAKLIIVEPFLLEASFEMQSNCVIPNINSYIPIVEEMAEVVRQLSIEYKIEFICLAEILRKCIKSGIDPARLSTDAIHPTMETVDILHDQILLKLAVNQYSPMSFAFDIAAIKAEYDNKKSLKPLSKTRYKSISYTPASKRYCAVGTVDMISNSATVLLENGYKATVHYQGVAPKSGFVNTYKQVGNEFEFEVIHFDPLLCEQSGQMNIAVNARQKQLVCGNVYYVCKDTVFFIRYSDTEWRLLRGRKALSCENYNVEIKTTSGYIVHENVLDDLAKVARCVVITGPCACFDDRLGFNDGVIDLSCAGSI